MNNYRGKSSDTAFLQPVAQDMEAVNRIIREQLHSDAALVGQVADYIINAGGKRVRPVLLLLVARALNCEDDRHHMLAAMIEFIHTATLLHDDVVDESDLRRGIPSANALFGNAASVLVGDFLYTRAFQMMVTAGSPRILEVMADTTNLVAEGEVLQLMNVRNVGLDEPGYFKVIYAKTAKLFEAASVVGALVSNANAVQVRAAATFGRALGMAFQIVDDMLDYAGSRDAMGKNTGHDLEEGKMTLPAIYLMKNGTDSQKVRIRQCIEEKDPEALQDVLAAVRSSQALAYAHQRAREVASEAKEALTVFDSSQYKKSLLELYSFMIERDF